MSSRKITSSSLIFAAFGKVKTNTKAIFRSYCCRIRYKSSLISRYNLLCLPLVNSQWNGVVASQTRRCFLGNLRQKKGIAPRLGPCEYLNLKVQSLPRPLLRPRGITIPLRLNSHQTLHPACPRSLSLQVPPAQLHRSPSRTMTMRLSGDPRRPGDTAPPITIPHPESTLQARRRRSLA